MTWGRWILISAAVLVAAGFIAFQQYWYYLPGIRAAIMDPIQPNKEVVWTPGPATAAKPLAERQPNIILIVADDLGYNDITLNGGGVANGAVPTPNIDGIAKAGANFTEGYSGNATCAPSRAAMMTGRYATRFGFEFTPTPLQFSQLISHGDIGNRKVIYHPEREAGYPAVEEMRIPQTEIMLPQMLKTQGYHTMGIGKWHLGDTPKARPEARGFDEYLGFMFGASMFLPEGDPNVVNSKQSFDQIDKFLWANLPYAVQHNGGRRFAPNKYMTDYLADEAAKGIAANKNQPFFMYVGFNAPHTPLQALKSDYDALPGIADHRLRVYAAMIKGLDRGVGTVLEAVKANGLEDNTIVIFTSDNGGAVYIGLPEINKPFRGWKSTFFEGGIRVPMFVKWPAKIPAGTTAPGAAGHVDIFATLAKAAGATLPTDRVMDGLDLVAVAKGEATLARKLFFRSNQYSTLRDGDWKVQWDKIQNKKWLFNLKDDPAEKTNQAEANPEQLATMIATLEQIDAEQAKPIWPSLLDAPIPIDQPQGGTIDPNGEYIYWAN